MSTALLQRSLVVARSCKARIPASPYAYACGTLAREPQPIFLMGKQQQHQQRHHQIRWNTSDSDECSNRNDSEAEVIYRSPMGDLITRLKIVSITSCVMSVVGLPLFVALKNGTLPTPQQMGLGGVAFLGATGSTVALHFVFGPYILTMEKIPVRLCHFTGGNNGDEEDDNSNVEAKSRVQDNDVINTDNKKAMMLRATTRSVFGWRSEHVFDPLTDVSFYTGSRPFANFVAKGVTLYAHPEMLNEDLRLLLLAPKVQEVKSDDDDDSFI